MLPSYTSSPPVDTPTLDPEDLLHEPLERARTIPSRWYTDSAFEAFDRRAILERTWQYVGPASDLASPGSYLPATVAGAPVVAVRDRDGTLRAFYNVCRHRGGPLALEPGCDTMLRCRYHGWTYRLNGELRGVPKFDRVDLFDRRDYGLLPVRIAEWEGMLFAALREDVPPIEEVTAGIAERIAPARLGNLHFHRRVVYRARCNWKVYVDNYLEGYHVPIVHAGLFGMLSFNDYVTETDHWHSLQHSPLRPGENIYAPEGGHAYYYLLFPNFALNILPGRLQTNLVVPDGQDHTQIIFDYYYSELEGESARTMIEEDQRSADVTQEEDIGICEHVQRGLASPAYDRGRYSVEMESAVHHFHDLIKTFYREELERSTE